MMRYLTGMLLLFVLLLPTIAQENKAAISLNTGVFVTTQDFASVRAAPARDAQRLSVIDPAVTLPAIRRTPDTDWIEVRTPDGQVGWIAALLLVWSGDMPGLTVFDPAPDVVPVADPNLQAAINTELDKDVFVTTQDFMNLRAGPGLGFDVLTVVPAAETLPVIGRSVNNQWLQVLYRGQRGWLFENYLVWTGEVVELPADGIAPEPFVRLGILGEVSSFEGIIAYEEYNTFDAIRTLPFLTPLEIIGSANGRFQVRTEDGQISWVIRRAVRITAGGGIELGTRTLTTAAERLSGQFRSDLTTGRNRLSQIDGIWNTIESGGEAQCSSAPEPLPARRGSDIDINREALFRPVATALDIAIGHVNTAIGLFTDACSRAEPFVTLADVRTAQDEIDAARRNYTLAQSLLNALPNF